MEEIKKFPIVIQGDWMQLTWEEGKDRKEALVAAASRWVQTLQDNADPDDVVPVRLDPAGPTGEGTPNLELKVQQGKLVINPALNGRLWSPDLGIPFQVVDGWETESVWTVPDTCE